MQGQGDNMNDNPLPSWADDAAKSAILDFVTRVTKEGGPSYVRPADRIATFDDPFKANLDHDMPAIAKFGKKGLLKVAAFVHGGMTEDELQTYARD
jgi:hypothetical protein